MEKTIYGPSMQRYVVGEKDGYIAVFYEQEQNGVNLKENYLYSRRRFERGRTS